MWFEPRFKTDPNVKLLYIIGPLTGAVRTPAKSFHSPLINARVRLGLPLQILDVGIQDVY